MGYEYNYNWSNNWLVSTMNLQAPIEGFEASFLLVQDLAELFFREIQKVQPEGPYLLAGHSFGALGFWVAEELKKP